MDTVPERLVAWLLRSAARATLLAGFAMLVAGGATLGMLSGDGVPHAIAVILLQIGANFALTGAAAIWLSQSRQQLLPNESPTVGDNQRPPVSGWLIAFAVVLIAAPLWLVFRLQPFLAEWRYVLGLLETPGLWDNANANMSGVVLIPLAAALTPPFFELAMLGGVAVTSATLLPLLMSRSPRFPRFYLVCVMLLSGLAFATMRGAEAATLASDALRQLVNTTSANAQEAATLRQALERYAIVGSTVPPLLATGFVYVLFIPAIVTSTRVRLTFAQRQPPSVSTPVTASDVAAITNPPRFPGAGF